MTVLQPTLDNYWGDSLTYPIVICTLVKFWPEGHWKLHNESYKKLAKLYNPGKNIPPEVTILTNNLFCRIISVLPSIPKITAENKKALTYNWRENIDKVTKSARTRLAITRSFWSSLHYCFRRWVFIYWSVEPLRSLSSKLKSIPVGKSSITNENLKKSKNAQKKVNTNGKTEEN